MNGDGERGQVVEREDFFAVHLPFFKSTVHTEGDERFVYSEASNESLDVEGERVLTDALLGSEQYFRDHGNVDIEHLTKIGRRCGIADPHQFEIGLPVEVRKGDRTTLVKSHIYRGPHVKQANDFWRSLTEQTPPARWFNSVAGRPLKRERVFNPVTGQHELITVKALWNNLAFSKDPMNLSVAPASTVGFDVFVKSLTLAAKQPACRDERCEGACCGDVIKALTAGPASSDIAARTGGAALTRQSLTGRVLAPWRPVAARYLRGLAGDADAQCPHTHAAPTRASLEDHFARCGGLDGPAARVAAREFLATLPHTTTALKRAA